MITNTFMVIEQEGEPVQYCSFKLETPISLWQLIYLHGKPERTVNRARWEKYRDGAFDNRRLGLKPQRVPFRPDLCEKMKQAHISDDSAVFNDMRAKIPELSRETGQAEKDLRDWLNKNVWLEHHVLEQILQIKDECETNDYALGFETQIFGGAKDFESDILVMKGHRLFYITITIAKKEKDNKLKLFEAYIRAQQLGGEQAKVALVTLSLDEGVSAARMENELRSDLHLHGKVFDRDHLKDTANFREELKNWFQ